MSTFDIKTGKMQMTFMQPTVQQPKSSADYKKTDFEVLARDVHPIDQIEFHKQVGEMIYSTMTNKEMIVHKLQSSLDISQHSTSWKRHPHRPRTTESSH